MVVAAIAPAVIGGIASYFQTRSNQRNEDTRAAQARAISIEDRDNERQYQEGWRDNEREYWEANDATRFTRLRDAAVSAGYSPISALGLGTTEGPTIGSGAALVPSSGVGGAVAHDWAGYVAQGAREAMSEVTGEAAQQRARQQLEDRLLDLRVQEAEGILARGLLPAGTAYGGGAGVSSRVVPSGLPVTTPNGLSYGLPVGAADYDPTPSTATSGLITPNAPPSHPAEAFEQEYGGFVGDIYGANRLISHWWDSIKDGTDAAAYAASIAARGYADRNTFREIGNWLGQAPTHDWGLQPPSNPLPHNWQFGQPIN